MADTRSTRMPVVLIAIALAGALSALFGGYWDDAWHTERGRDSFFIAPHVLIYAGVGLVGLALALWVGTSARRAGIRHALANPAARLAAVAVAVTFASGPVDDAWHRAFGRDAVIWSPPHMLGIVATLVLGAALLAETTRTRRAAAILAGGLVVAAANFTVVEYDTDVPQFDAVWYLPALALASAAAFSLVRVLLPRRLAAMEAAAAHLGFILLVAGFLRLQGLPGPALPLLVVPAAAVDLGSSRGWSLPTRTAVFVASLFAVYVPARNWLGSGVEIDPVDVALGMPLAYAAALPVFALALPRGGRPAGLRPVTLPALLGAALFWVLATALALPPAALGHDPGQGEAAGSARLAVVADGDSVAVRGRLNARDCRGIRGERLVARRAGVERRAPLALSGCSFRGELTVTGRGRWFVYARFRQRGRPLETWLPVETGAGRTRAHDEGRFVYVPPERSTSAAKIAGGVLLYGAMVALLGATFRLTGIRRAAAPARRQGLP